MNKHAEKFPNVFLTQGLIDLEAYGLTDTKPKLRVIAQLNPNKLHFRHQDIDEGIDYFEEPDPVEDELATNDLVGDNIPQLNLDDISEDNDIGRSEANEDYGYQDFPDDQYIAEYGHTPDDDLPDLSEQLAKVRGQQSQEKPAMPEWKQQLEEWLRANQK